MNHIENTVFTVVIQQYLDRCMHIRCPGNPFTEQLPSDSPVIADVFTGRYQATAAVYRLNAQQRVYTPLYYPSMYVFLDVSSLQYFQPNLHTFSISSMCVICSAHATAPGFAILRNENSEGEKL
jgi:hypothetical protein